MLPKVPNNKLIIISDKFTTKDLFPFISHEPIVINNKIINVTKTYTVDNKAYIVKMGSDRYKVFNNSIECVICKLQGSVLLLERARNSNNVTHFNLYGEEFGKLVLFTKDHIIPRSKGGSQKLENYQTMCSVCNSIKRNYKISNEQILLEREYYNKSGGLYRKICQQ